MAKSKKAKAVADSGNKSGGSAAAVADASNVAETIDDIGIASSETIVGGGRETPYTPLLAKLDEYIPQLPLYNPKSKENGTIRLRPNMLRTKDGDVFETNLDSFGNAISRHVLAYHNVDAKKANPYSVRRLRDAEGNGIVEIRKVKEAGE